MVGASGICASDTLPGDVLFDLAADRIAEPIATLCARIAVEHGVTLTDVVGR